MLHDVRYAARSLAKRPWVTVAAAISLALGMGAAAIIFSWVQGVLWHPLSGVIRQSELFAIGGQSSTGGSNSYSYPDYVDLRDGAQSLEALIACNAIGLNVGPSDGRPAEQIFGSFVTAGYFEVLGVTAALGRTFSRTEAETPNGPAVAVISHRLWQRRFDGAPAVVGSTIVINNRQFEIIGVAPEQFWGTLVGADLEVWLPMATQGTISATDLLNSRSVRWLQLHARLKPGVTPEQAQADLDRVVERLSAAYPDVYQNRRALVLPLWLTPWGAPALMRGILMVLSVAVSFVLLLTAANVANLLVARALDRRREMAMRQALGASRGRLIKQMLLESLLLGLLGGVGATFVASWSSRLLSVLSPPAGFSIRFNVHLDTTVLVFVICVAVVTGILSGVAFAIHGSRADAAVVLREEAQSLAGGVSGARLRRVFVAAEVAIATIVLIAATMSLRSIQRAEHINPGFNPDGVFLAGYDLRSANYSPERGRVFHQRVLERLRSVPGVQGVTLARSVPLGLDGFANSEVTVDGYNAAPSEDLHVRMNTVGPEYFRQMQIPLRGGRDFAERDNESAPLVAIVNETMAKRYWKGDPVGSRFSAGNDVLEVIGVAADSKIFNVSEVPPPHFYRPVLQQYRPDMVLHLRAADPALSAEVREAFHELDPNLPVLRLYTLRAHMRTSLFPQLMARTLLTGLAFLSIILVLVGLCSVIAYAVSQRRRELAIRLAFGATQRQVVGLIIREGALVVGIGVALGVAIAASLGRYASPLLLGMPAFDPLAFGGASLTLIVLAMGSALMPALGARRVEPIVALRHQ
jgi:predicted permease